MPLNRGGLLTSVAKPPDMAPPAASDAASVGLKSSNPDKGYALVMSGAVKIAFGALSAPKGSALIVFVGPT